MVGLLVVPLQVTFIPVLSLFRDAELFGYKLSGSFLAVWLAHTGYGLPFAIYLLRNYIGGLPRSVFEAAAIDGAGHVNGLLPTRRADERARPWRRWSSSSSSGSGTICSWHSVFLGPVPENHPLSVMLANLTTNFGGNWQFVTAAAFVSMIVPIIVFLCCSGSSSAASPEAP